MLRPTTATISSNSPRHIDWLTILGTRTVPITSPAPKLASGPDGTINEFYLLDHNQLSAAQLHRLIAHIAKKWNLPQIEVRRTMEEYGGVPILAEDVIVACDIRLFF